MTEYFLGVDIGNTKSHALIITDTGAIAGFGSGGPGNHEVLGVDGFRQALHVVVDDALKNARLDRSQIAGAGYGIAGYDWLSDLPMMREVIDTLGMNAPYNVVNDGMMGLVAGARQGWGVSVSAGTSSNARSRNAQGDEGRLSGNGWVCGEYGGGIELVYEALDAISRAWSMRAPATLLSELFVAHLGAPSVEALLEGVARGTYHMRATYAPLVFEAVDKGDAVAREKLRWISRELGNLAVGVIRQVNIENEAFEVVLAGSFYKGSPLIAEWMREVVHEVAPRAELVRLEAPPVVGSALLGVEAAGREFTSIREAAIQGAGAAVAYTPEE